MSTKGYNQGGRISHYDPTLNATYTSGLWKTCPLLEYMHDPSIGVMLDERFNSYNAVDDYTLTQAGVVGTGTISTAAPGVLELDSGSTDATKGAQIQRNISSTCFIPAAAKHIWFEARFKIVDTYDKCELFVGLSSTDTSIISGSGNSSIHHIGFQCVTDDGVLLFTSEKNTAGTTTTSGTIAEATYVNVGFYVNGVTSVEGYYNGASVGTAHATANVPIVAMFPSFVCQSGGTNDPVMHLAGYRVFQLR